MHAEDFEAESGLSPVRVGLIGCGGHASNCIHPSLRYLPQIQVVAVCDLDESRARATAQRLGVSAVYTQTDRMLANEQPEAVIVIGPPAMQNPVGHECLERGCHLLIDKPPGLCPADARRLAEAADASGLIGREHAVDRGRAYLLIERCQGGGDSELGDEEDSEHAAPGPAAESDPGLRSLAGIEVEPLDHYASVSAPAVRGNRS